MYNIKTEPTVQMQWREVVDQDTEQKILTCVDEIERDVRRQEAEIKFSENAMASAQLTLSSRNALTKNQKEHVETIIENIGKLAADFDIQAVVDKMLQLASIDTRGKNSQYVVYRALFKWARSLQSDNDLLKHSEAHRKMNSLGNDLVHKFPTSFVQMAAAPIQQIQTQHCIIPEHRDKIRAVASDVLSLLSDHNLRCNLFYIFMLIVKYDVIITYEQVEERDSIQPAKNQENEVSDTSKLQKWFLCFLLGEINAAPPTSFKSHF